MPRKSRKANAAVRRNQARQPEGIPAKLQVPPDLVEGIPAHQQVPPDPVDEIPAKQQVPCHVDGIPDKHQVPPVKVDETCKNHFERNSCIESLERNSCTENLLENTFEGNSCIESFERNSCTENLDRKSGNECSAVCTGKNPAPVEMFTDVCGSFHQGDLRFSEYGRGTQCTCNALLALCHLSETFNMTSSDLDQILVRGDELHTMLVQYFVTGRYKSPQVPFE